MNVLPLSCNFISDAVKKTAYDGNVSLEQNTIDRTRNEMKTQKTKHIVVLENSCMPYIKKIKGNTEKLFTFVV